MSVRIEPGRKEVIFSSLGGLCQGTLVRIVIHPLDVVRTKQQIDTKGNCLRVAVELLKKEGVCSFYRGFTPKLCLTAIKQVFVCPIVICAPHLLHRRVSFEKQIFAGLACGTVDAIVSAPFEKAKIQQIIDMQKTRSILDGWKGFGVQWIKSSLGYTTFLVVQRLLRNSWGDPKTLSELIRISTVTALAVTLISAPFDKAYAFKASKNRSFQQVLASGGSWALFRGSPLRFIDVFIQTTGFLALMCYLEKQ